MTRTILRLVLTSLVLNSAPALGQTDAAIPPPTFDLRPGDVIKLRIWREPELTGDFPVLEDGHVILPRLGPWLVVGKPLAQLKQDLVEAYSQFLRNPSVEVIVLWRVNILGQVRNPGIHTLDPTMTVTDAIAMAGGPLPDADRKKIILTRDNSITEIQLDRVYTVSDLAIQSGDQLYVPQRSWLVRNWQTTISAASLLVGILLAVTR